MNERKITESVCTLSWIDKKTGLPENDGDGPPSVLSGHKVTREDDALPFRFLNLLEATIMVSGSVPPRIVSSAFTSASKIYQNLSFGKIESEAFQTKQSISPGRDRVVFQQTVGARTVSPEVIGETVGSVVGVLVRVPVVGDKVGRKVAHEVLGFPPIWTTLQLTLFAEGRSEGLVLCHSLFPSMNYYARASRDASVPRITSSYQLVGRIYDAVKHLEEWKTRGWGSLRTTPSGPCEGNPWGLSKSDLTVRPVRSATRTA